MEYSEKFNANLFKDKSVAELVKDLCDKEGLFVTARADRTLTGILLGLQQAFPHERDGIKVVLSAKITAQNPVTVAGAPRSSRFGQTKKKPTRVIHMQQPVAPPVSREVDFENPATGETDRIKIPDEWQTFRHIPENVFEAKDLQNGESMQVLQDGESGRPTITEEMVKECKTWRDIVSLFSGNFELFEDYFEQQSISRGNVKNTEKLAKKLYAHYNAV